MKRNIGLMGFASLLLMATLAIAETPTQNGAPAAPQAGVTAAAPGAAPFCAAGLFNTKSTDFTFTPKPSAKTYLCGSCSYSSCQGMAPNSSCYYLDRFGYHLAKCVINYACEGSTNGCDCTNNGPV
jgi:hypothetical protein